LDVEVVPNLFHIEGRASNVYIWRGDEGLLLVDTGFSSDVGAVLETIESLGHSASDVAAIAITHADLDHAGGAALLHERTGAPILAGAQSAALLGQGKAPKHMPWLIQFFSDHFFGYRSVPEEGIGVVADGDRLPGLEDWQVLATPGHSPDHHSFYSRLHGILFTGDALNTRGGRLQSSPKRITGDPEAARQSAMRLLRLTPAVIACGHGRPMTSHDAGTLMSLYSQLHEQSSS
jgi:glyoxylase-like metal-dependent hydrolase (beta-lactamase superfamily II)